MGRALLQQLLRHAGAADVLLTTISSRIGFYRAAGFQQLQLKEVPRCAAMQARCSSTSAASNHGPPRRSLLFEVIAGTAVARIAAGEELVVLKRAGGGQPTP